MRRSKLTGFTVCALTAVTSSAFAGSHTWRFSELFTNASGTVQFVELYVGPNAFETGVAGLQITTGTNTFTFPGNLTGPTTEKRLLLGTTAFAALPGAPTPDYTIPANFFAVGGGFTIRYNPPGNYDSNVVSVGGIPTDGIKSLTYTSFNGGNVADTFVTNQNNSPRNYNGSTGSVNAGCSDADGDGFGSPGSAACSGGPQTDCNDNNPNIRPNQLEQDSAGNCGDGADNDCDTLVDCAEAGCATAVPACIPTVSEWGVLVMGLLTLTAGSVMLRHRS